MDPHKVTRSIIVAASTNNAIGKADKLLWHLPNDMRFFKNTTWGMPVIMGRKTWATFKKGLPGRLNVVITRNAHLDTHGGIVVSNLSDALTQAETANTNEIFIGGGGEIYKEAMAVADKIYLTRVHAHLEGDTFFPEISTQEWELVSAKHFEPDEKHAYAYTFETWLRK